MKKTNWHRSIISAAVAIPLVCCFAIQAEAAKPAAAASAPVPVTVMKLEPVTYTHSTEAIGDFSAGEAVSLKIPGIADAQQVQIQQVYFLPGQRVKKGQRLIQLDDSTQRALLQQDLAIMKSDQSDYQAKLALYQKGRYVSLYGTDGVVTAKSLYLKQVAMVSADKIAVQKMQIRSPIDGTITSATETTTGTNGTITTTNYHVGDFVSTNSIIARIYNSDKDYIEYQLSSAYLDNLHIGNAIHVSPALTPEEKYPATVYYIAPDINDGMVTLRARLNKPQSALKPGSNVNVTQLVESYSVYAIPRSSDCSGGPHDTINVVENNHVFNKTKQRFQRNGVSAQSGRYFYLKVGGGTLRNNDLVVVGCSSAVTLGTKVKVTKTIPSSIINDE